MVPPSHVDATLLETKILTVVLGERKKSHQSFILSLDEFEEVYSIFSILFTEAFQWVGRMHIIIKNVYLSMKTQL